MSNYRKIIKQRIILLCVVSIFALGFCVFDQFFASEELKNNNIFGFQLGAISAIAILSAFNVVRYKKILQDEKKLQIEYNKENDERNKTIRKKAGIPIVLFTSVAMIIAGVIAGYFNILIFYTLIITALCQLTVSAVLKVVYMRKL